MLVPTRAAAEQLRRTIEHLYTDTDARARIDRHVCVLPQLLTRDEWYHELHKRLAHVPPLLSVFEREVIARAAARDAVTSGASPPFKLRPGLVGTILDFYDALMRHGPSVAAFERLVVDDLQPSVDVDRGARRLLRQTRFLVAAFRAYERRVEAAGRLDEHSLRRLSIGAEAARPFTRVVVTAPDRTANPAGLWPADFDLLARLPRLAAVDVIATDAVLDAGFRERIDALLPGIEEERLDDSSARLPVVVAPASLDRLHFVWRDREEELTGVVRARRRRAPPVIPGGPCEPADAVAVVFQRPLPYLYLARQLFQACGVSCEAPDGLPLATEPYAAAVDLLVRFVSSGYSRRTTIELLRSPHFSWKCDGQPLDPTSIDALDRALQERRYVGSRGVLNGFVAEWAAEEVKEGGRSVARARPAVECAARLADELSPFERPQPTSRLLSVLQSFLKRHVAPLTSDDPLCERETQTRNAIWTTMSVLEHAHGTFDCVGGDGDGDTSVGDLTSSGTSLDREPNRHAVF